MNIILLMLPIFTMIGIGSLFVWRGWFPEQGLPVLNRFVMSACIPVLLFSAIANGKSLADFAWANAFVFAAASLVSTAILWIALRLLLRQPQSQSIILALGAATANSIFLGFPIAAIVIPERAADVISWVVFAETAVVIPLITTLAIFSEQRTAIYTTLKTMLLSPVILGLGAGFLFLATGLSLPGWLDHVVHSIVSAGPFIALFVIGGNLLQFRIIRSGPRVIAISIGKLLIHPLAVAAAFGIIFGWQNPVVKEAVLFACMPLFLSYVVFCERHKVSDVGASAIAITTLIGAISVPAVLSFLF